MWLIFVVMAMLFAVQVQPVRAEQMAAVMCRPQIEATQRAEFHSDGTLSTTMSEREYKRIDSECGPNLVPVSSIVTLYSEQSLADSVHQVGKDTFKWNKKSFFTAVVDPSDAGLRGFWSANNFLRKAYPKFGSFLSKVDEINVAPPRNAKAKEQKLYFPGPKGIIIRTLKGADIVSALKKVNGTETDYQVASIKKESKEPKNNVRVPAHVGQQQSLGGRITRPKNHNESNKPLVSNEKPVLVLTNLSKKVEEPKDNSAAILAEVQRTLTAIEQKLAAANNAGANNDSTQASIFAAINKLPEEIKKVFNGVLSAYDSTLAEQYKSKLNEITQKNAELKAQIVPLKENLGKANAELEFANVMLVISWIGAGLLGICLVFGVIKNSKARGRYEEYRSEVNGYFLRNEREKNELYSKLEAREKELEAARRTIEELTMAPDDAREKISRYDTMMENYHLHHDEVTGEPELYRKVPGTSQVYFPQKTAKVFARNIGRAKHNLAKKTKEWDDTQLNPKPIENMFKLPTAEPTLVSNPNKTNVDEVGH